MTAASMWFVNTVTVATYLGENRDGPVFADAVTVACWVEDASDTVFDSAGEQVTSSARVFAAVSAAATFAPQSEVTLPSGRTARVLRQSRFVSGTLALGLDHVEVALT